MEKRLALLVPIRKANPRGEMGAPKVRIVRRGITYGARRIQLTGDYQAVKNQALKNEVGLLFMSFQADIDSFETLQKRADDNNFVQNGAGVDPIIGRPGNDFVTLKGGEYFFAPSIKLRAKISILPAWN
jgi:deferrochelatase/peroxidase EfeB